MKLSSLRLASRRASRQAGFSLLEVAVLMSLLAGMLMTVLMLWRDEASRMQQKLAGQQYRVMESALNDYLGLYYLQLLQLPTDCGQVSLAVQRSLPSSPSVLAGACTLSLPRSSGGVGKVTLSNGLQPTLEDLQALHVLDASFRPGLALPTLHVVAQPSAHIASNDLAAPRLAIRIEKLCAPSTCREFTLTGLVFNTQPYSYGPQRSLIDSHEMALNAFVGAGPQAALSSPRALKGDGELQGWMGSFRMTNPLRSWAEDGSSEGLPGVLGVRVVLGSARLGGLALADGSHPTTGNWNFQGHDVTGVRLFGADSAEVGRLQVQELTVAGPSFLPTLSTQSASAERVSVERLKLPRAASGTACDASTESLSLALDASTVLVCRADVWSIPSTSPK